MITCPQCGTENREDARFCNRCGAALQRPLGTGPLPPSTVLQDRYQVVSLLGQGGMGAVYRARDTRLDVLVALKEMTPQPGLDPYTLAQLRQQFWQEAAVLARLDHSNLVRVTDFFEEGGNAYLVMNFVEGESLADRIEQQGAQPEDQVLGWAGQLLDALAHCHSQGIVHRDVKPQNVILRPDGRAVLVDFGLVKLWDPHDPRTKTAMRGMGTPEYAPPEQYDLGPGNTDPRSDVYSLGATMYHALTGQAPPTATQRIASRSAFRPPRVLNKHISPVTEVTVLRALELMVEDRFPTARDMAAALAGRTRAPIGRTRISAWVWVLVALLSIGGPLVLLVATGNLPVPPFHSNVQRTEPPRPTAIPTPMPIPTTAVPSPTHTPTRTPTPLPASTDTPSLSPTATRVAATRPVLVFPEHGQTYRSPIALQWQGRLGAEQIYVVHLWHPESGFDIRSPLTSGTSWTADLPADKFGEWRWNVSVVENSSMAMTSAEGMFWFNPFPGGGGQAGFQSPIPSPEPDSPTAPVAP